MTSQKRRQRFVMRWRSRQGPWTLWDLDKRDRLLYPFSSALYKCGFTANRITLLGFLWTLVWIGCYEYFKFRNPPLHLWVFIIPIGITDLLDGSTARNNANVTSKGTFGDHFRDLVYTVYMGRIALDFGFETTIFIGVLIVEFCILALKAIAFVWYGGGYTWERFWEFSLDNFQHTYEDRWQSNFLYFGIPSYIVGSYYDFSPMSYAGYVMIIISFGVGFMVIRKELVWTPTPTDELEKE